MADTMQFDLVSPERRLASLQATLGADPRCRWRHDGDAGPCAAHHHAASRRAAASKARTDTAEYVVTGGFAEINGESASVLAEKAIPLDEVTHAHIDEMMEEARAAHEAAKTATDAHAHPVDDAAKLLSDMVAMGDHITV